MASQAFQAVWNTPSNDLTVVRLDLANAYESIPHDLIQERLNHYYIPEAIQDMITSYLAGLKLRFTSALFNTGPKRDSNVVYNLPHLVHHGN